MNEFKSINKILLRFQRMIRFLYIPNLNGPGYKSGMSMSDYLHNAEKIADRGDYQKALQRYIWFHNHCLELEESMYGVRLSFALSSWIDLTTKFPPALEALKRIRDGKTQSIIKGEGNKRSFHDVQSINEHLNECSESISLFKFLDKFFPSLAKSCWWMVKMDFINAEEMEIFEKYSPDILSEFNIFLKRTRAWKEFLEKKENSLKVVTSPDSSKRVFQENFFNLFRDEFKESKRSLEKISWFFHKILINSNRHQEANKIIEMSLEFFDSEVNLKPNNWPIL